MSLWKESSSKRKFGITAAVVGAILALAVVAVLTTGCYGALPTPAAPTTAAPTPEPEPTQPPDPEATDTPEPEATQPPEPEATDTPEPEATQPPEPEAQPPTAVISVSQEGVTDLLDGPVLVPAGQPVHYLGTASVPGSSPITSYQWDFGAGEVAQGQVVVHTFNAPGAYSVTLAVTDEDGESNTVVQQVQVEYWH